MTIPSKLLSIDSVLGYVSRPVVFWSLVLLFLYILPVIWARVLIIASCSGVALQYLNKLYKRRGTWDKIGEDDIALVTGGANGLGLEVSKLLIRKNVKVIILDKEEIIDPVVLKRVTAYYKCDLNSEQEINQTMSDIRSKFGLITILVNNAAVRQHELLKDISLSQITTILNVNTMAPIILLRECLKESPKRFYAVTVASVLGLVSPSHLSIYSASKAAIISLHDTLSHETNDLNVRFLLVTPGQLDTRMFKDVNPPKQYLAPVVDARELAVQIVKKIEVGERGTLHGPVYTYFIPLLRLLPFSLNEFARWFSEIDTSVNPPKEH